MTLLESVKWIGGGACVALALVWLAMAWRADPESEFRFSHLFQGRLPRNSSRTQLLIEGGILLGLGALAFLLL